MNLRVPADARPQVRTLLAVTLLSVALWFIPFAGYLTYPFKLFVTFIHEGGHALAAWLTWNSVLSLSVAPDTSGLTITTQGGFFSQLLVSSAGYVGSMAYGALLLVLIRKAMAARYVLFGSAGLVLVLTLFFGLLLPIGHIATDFWASVPFTLVSGLVIAGALIAVGMWTSPARSLVLRQFSGGAMRAERAVGLENRILYVHAFFYLRAQRRRESGKSDGLAAHRLGGRLGGGFALDSLRRAASLRRQGGKRAGKLRTFRRFEQGRRGNFLRRPFSLQKTGISHRGTPISKVSG